MPGACGSCARKIRGKTDFCPAMERKGHIFRFLPKSIYRKKENTHPVNVWLMLWL
jgi:hypothetical protein